MRRAVSLMGLAAPQFCLAGSGFLGTKSGGSADFQAGAYTSPVNGMAIVQLLVALGIVFILVRYLLPKALTKVNRRLNPSLGGIRIEESASFAGGNLYVVTARSKTLLLATSGTAVTCLADLTEAPPSAAEPQTFQEMLDIAPGSEPKAGDPFEETLARLDRLDRIVKS